jgi:hypothetical protein
VRIVAAWIRVPSTEFILIAMLGQLALFCRHASTIGLTDSNISRSFDAFRCVVIANAASSTFSFAIWSGVTLFSAFFCTTMGTV